MRPTTPSAVSSLSRLSRPLRRRLLDGTRAVLSRDDGDVPGWVLITLMTAAIVIAIWAIAGPALEGLISQAVERFEGL